MSYVVTPIDINGIMHIDPPDFKYKPGDCGYDALMYLLLLHYPSTTWTTRKLREAVSKLLWNDFQNGDEAAVIAMTFRSKIKSEYIDTIITSAWDVHSSGDCEWMDYVTLMWAAKVLQINVDVYMTKVDGIVRLVDEYSFNPDSDVRFKVYYANNIHYVPLVPEVSQAKATTKSSTQPLANSHAQRLTLALGMSQAQAHAIEQTQAQPQALRMEPQQTTNTLPYAQFDALRTPTSTSPSPSSSTSMPQGSLLPSCSQSNVEVDVALRAHGSPTLDLATYSSNPPERVVDSEWNVVQNVKRRKKLVTQYSVGNMMPPTMLCTTNQFAVIAPEGEDIEEPNTSACQPSKPTSTQTNPRQLSNPSSPPQPNVDTITNTNVQKSGRIREVVGKPDYNEIDSADDMVVVISNTVREKARLRQQQCRAK